MHTHNNHEPDDHQPEEIDASHGFERTDVRVTCIVVFLTAFLFSWWWWVHVDTASESIDTTWPRKTGKERWAPRSMCATWATCQTTRDAEQNGGVTQQFPLPRVQTDDGNQDVADLHAREDLLLEHYSWVDQSQGKVRIPIDRAIHLLAQRGLPVAAAGDTRR